jgi:DNA polymerase III epsilon subunit-like protein
MGLDFWVIDTETNGMKTGWHEIFQISLIHYPSKLQLSKDIRVEFPERSNQESLNITGKTRDQIVIGENKEAVVEAVDNFLLQHGKSPEFRCIIGHSVNFDMRFCHALWNSCGKKMPASLWLDTKEVTRIFSKKMGMIKPKLNLEAALTLTGTTPTSGTAHNAVKDARDCYRLFCKLIEEGVDYVPKIKRIPHL